MLNEKCAEAAVVGFEHPIKGQGIYAYVTLMDDVVLDDALKKELVMCASPAEFVVHQRLRACHRAASVVCPAAFQLDELA